MRVVKIRARPPSRRSSCCSSSPSSIVASTFDPNDYKGVATDAFTARTGRTLTIDEDLRLAYFPWLAVETGGVTIGSAADVRRRRATVRDGAPRRGAREAAAAPVAPRRDRHRRARRPDAEPRARRELTRQLGRPRSTPASAPAPARRRARRRSVDELAIEGVRISDGNVYWRENTNELRYSVTGLSLTTGGIGSGEPVEFDAALDFADETSGLKAALAASAVVAAAANGSVTATDVEAERQRRRRRRRAGARARSDGRRASRSTARPKRWPSKGLVTEIAGIRAAWQLAGTALLANPTVAGQRRRRPAAELATVFEQLQLSPPASLDAERARHVHARRAVQLPNGAAGRAA